MSDFQWTDELVKEFVRFPILSGESSKDIMDMNMRHFKAFVTLRNEKPVYHPLRPEWEIVERGHAGVMGSRPEDPKEWPVIWGVKRLSDGEIFRVGDKVRDKLGNYGFIKSMVIEEDSFYVNLDSAENKGWWMTLYLKDLINGWKTPEEILKEFRDTPWTFSDLPPAANGKVPVWLTPEQEGKLNRLLALFNDPMAGAVSNKPQ